MVSVCASCKGLQKHLHGLDSTTETEPDVVRWVNTSLPDLRTSSGSCRACALLLNGILLHHDRFAGQKEDDIWVTAESYNSKNGNPVQDHLSVDVRWTGRDEQDQYCQDDEHEHAAGYPDLKLEFFTDGGKRQPL